MRWRMAGPALALLVLIAAPLASSTAAATSPPPAPHLLVALGDSITTAWGSGLDASGNPIADDNPSASWATGDDPAVSSHAQRIAALFGQQPVAVNLAEPGRKVTDGEGVVAQAAAAPAGTDYALIETGSADLCSSATTTVDAMTSVADFRTAIGQALATLVSRFPSVHILVASIPNWYGLWQTLPSVARPADTCPLLFSTDPTIANATTRAAVQQRTIDYNAALASACAAVAACRYDGGAVYALSLGAADVSAYDHFHPSVAGQAKIAAATWPTSWWSGAVAPTPTSPPVISGVPVVGTPLTATTGTWSGSPAPTLTEQWLRCNGTSCTPIAGATSTTYTPQQGDVGSTLEIDVTATNAGGTADAVSAKTSPVAPKATGAPVNTALPTVSGVTQNGQTLTATNGAWSNNPTDFIGQWLRCSSSSCAEIAGATSGTYTATQQDVGSTIRFRLTAINAAGSTVATSAATATIIPLQHLLIVDTLFAQSDVWTVAVDRNGVAYGTSSSPTAPPNVLYRSYDEGRTWAPLYTFPDGSAIAGVISVLRDNTLLASISINNGLDLFRSDDGGASWTDVFQFLPGYQTLGPASIADDGTYVYLGSYNVLDAGDHPNWVWRSADDGRTWTIVRATTNHRHIHGIEVDPATGAVYVLYGDSATQAAIERSTDHGATWSTVCTGLDCVAVELAFDGSGSAIFGTDHPTSPSFVQRLNLASGGLTAIAGLPGASYSSFNLGNGVWLLGTTHEPTSTNTDTAVHLFGSADNGATFGDVLSRPFNSQTNITALTVNFAYPSGDFPVQITQEGAGTLVARVHSTRPVSTAVPAVQGTARTGSSLTASTGTWAGAGSISYGYQWQSCPVGGVCTDIAGATGSSFVPTAATIGRLIRVRVTAANAGGSTVAASPPTAAVVDGGNVTLSITQTIATGQTLKGRISWAATVTAGSRTIARVVFAIDGRTVATDTTAPYTVGTSFDTTSIPDGRHTFTATATATDGSSATATAVAIVQNGQPPANVVAPLVIGIPRVRLIVATTVGLWRNGPTSFSIQWQRCSPRTHTCTNIPGETHLVHVVTSADAGNTLQSVVTASNASGSTSATSQQTRIVTG